MRNSILVIDDEPTIRMILKKYLEKNYDVEAKANGLEALEWLEGNLPDLVICDIEMPSMNGYEFLDKFRNRGYTKRTPVIMLSGAESSKERVKCYNLRAQDFLVKPFNPEELSALIKKNLEPIHYAQKW